MFCQNCGTQVLPGQQFCSGCSRPLGDYAVAVHRSRLERNIQLLGVFWMAYSAITLLGGVVLVILANTLFIELTRNHGAPFFLHPLLTAVGCFLLVKAVVGIAAGWGLMQREPWARMLALVLGFLALIHPPFGTALGIYTIWVLMSPNAETEYLAMARAHA